MSTLVCGEHLADRAVFDCQLAETEGVESRVHVGPWERGASPQLPVIEGLRGLATRGDNHVVSAVLAHEVLEDRDCGSLGGGLGTVHSRLLDDALDGITPDGKQVIADEPCGRVHVGTVGVTALGGGEVAVGDQVEGELRVCVGVHVLAFLNKIIQGR